MEAVTTGRAGFELLGRQYPPAAGVSLEHLVLAGVPCTWIRPGKPLTEEVIVYIHGGAFIYGSLESHAPMVSHIASALERNILLIGYRLAPEHPFPAGIEDGVAVINALRTAYPAIRFGMIGDSAGGNLSMAIQLQLRELGGTRPCYSILVSPWVDLTCTNASYTTNQDTDVILNRPYLEWAAGLYAGTSPLHAPLLSPVYAPLEGLAPVQILYGTAEILAGDSIQLYQKLLAAGVKAELLAFEAEQHVWPFLDIDTRAAQQALQAMRTFADAHQSTTQEAL